MTAAQPHIPDRGATRRRSTTLEVRTSTEAIDPQWDDFVAGAGGSHLQTSMWSAVKAGVGWTTQRVYLVDRDAIVAGAQLSTRQLPPRGLPGTVGFVNRGPVISCGREELAPVVTDALQALARRRHIRYLLLEPAPGPVDVALRPHLAASGFAEGSLVTSTPATTVLELTATEDELLAGMKKKTRHNARKGSRTGVEVREGGGHDVPVFYDMLRSTAERQGFDTHAEHYYRTMWDVMGRRGHAKLFVASFEGEPVAAQIAIAFGDTVVSKMQAWSGKAAKARPNETLDWYVIRWAKANGYRYFDFDGVGADAARAVLAGEELPEAARQTVTSYKLSFGGRPVILPPAHTYVPNRLAARAVAAAARNDRVIAAARRAKNAIRIR